MRHPSGQGTAPGQPVYPQAGSTAALGMQAAQHAQQQQDWAAAHELLALSRQQGRDSGLAQARHAGQAILQLPAQRGDAAGQEAAAGLSPRLRTGSGQLEEAALMPTALSPKFAVGHFGQPARPEQDTPVSVGTGQAGRSGSGQFIRIGSGPFAQTFQAVAGHHAEAMVQAQRSLARASSIVPEVMGLQAPSYQAQDSLAAQLQQRSRSYPPHAMQPQALGANMAAQQQQQQQQQEQQHGGPSCLIAWKMTAWERAACSKSFRSLLTDDANIVFGDDSAVTTLPFLLYIIGVTCSRTWMMTDND